jgi:cbb3-type cytochrome oxidase subunit 3
MVATALLLLVIVHPGIYFPTLRKQKRGQADQEALAAEKTGNESSSDEGVAGRN